MRHKTRRAILGAAVARDQGLALEPIEEAGDARRLLDHARPDLQGGEALGPGSPQDSQHVVLLQGDAARLRHVGQKAAQEVAGPEEAQGRLFRGRGEGPCLKDLVLEGPRCHVPHARTRYLTSQVKRRQRLFDREGAPASIPRQRCPPPWGLTPFILVPEGRTLSLAKQVLLGKPIPSDLAQHQRLSKTTGLAVLSSDALSSVAYATEEVVRTLILAGATALWLATPIGIVIALLLLVVAFSYRQTIHAYPNGGGAYIVARSNLGDTPGLIAAAALLIDYVLTVAVSICAGVAAVTSAFPAWHLSRTELSLIFLTLLAVGNLRGVKESGRIFAVPTYFFLVMLMSLIAAGAWRYVTGQVEPVTTGETALPTGTHALTVFLVLRAFANGCTAMTGVEAISNGVPAFKPPEEKNAAATLVAMAVLSVTLFMGITLLAHAYGVVPREDETVVSMLARGVFGGRNVAYYMVQAATMAILVLAANTAYADFPRLASIVARDRYLPRQFMNQGDRLAFSNGIIVLSVLAAVLIVVFAGDTHALIPLYMIGVFVSFTLSQAGMVVKLAAGAPAPAGRRTPRSTASARS